MTPEEKTSPNSILRTHKPDITDRPSCLYIAGSGRNGSTFLGLQLERSPDIVFAGELTHLWERGLQQNQLCGCGVPFRDCDFWKEVLKSAFGKLSAADLSRITALRRRVSGLSGLMALRFGRRHVDTEVADEYAGYYRSVITAIQDVSSCRLVVDSSKYPTDLAGLLQGNLIPSILHLVRDCNAVVYSWRRKRQRTEIHWRTQLMPRYGAIQTALGWRNFNSVIDILADIHHQAYQLLRYEDLVTDFSNELDRLLSWLSCRSPTASDRNIIGHSVSGNPCRFKFQPSRVQPDIEWQSGQSMLDRWVVRVLCGRQQRSYGY